MLRGFLTGIPSEFADIRPDIRQGLDRRRKAATPRRLTSNVRRA
jgi:hypothetical protein